MWIDAKARQDRTVFMNEQMSGDDVVTIRDDATGSSASILTTVGFNCFRFIAIAGDSNIDVLYAEEEFGPESTLSLHGIPLLFPFAGRLKGEWFEFQGREYHITGVALNFGGNVAHGFVLSRPWRIVHQAENEVTGEFHASVDDPSLLEQWPADFRIQVTYRVVGAGLISDIVIENPDDDPLPFGFGTHPYFRLPADPKAALESVVTVPAAEVWDHDGGLPTGNRLEAAGRTGFRDGKRFSELVFDGVLTALKVRADGLVHTSIDDQASGFRIDQSFPPVFQNCVIYTPEHRGAVAVEPWTTVPDAFSLSARGIETGLIVLPPGEQWATRIVIKAVQIDS